MRSLMSEVPSRFELLYTVLQTATYPLGQGTVLFSGAKIGDSFQTTKYSFRKFIVFIFLGGEILASSLE